MNHFFELFDGRNLADVLAGISILYRKGKEEETHLFSFLEPLEFQVWLFVATSLLGISITLFIVSR